MALGRNSRIGVFVVGITIFTDGTLFAGEMNNTKYAFEKEPYVHPKIIEDLTTWKSDRGEQVVAINLWESADANRYWGDIKVNKTKRSFVFYEKGEECFGYRFIGKSSSGIFVLLTESSSGGTSVFRDLLLVSLEKDRGLSYDRKNNSLRFDRERWIIKKLGEITLGDRYEGKIFVKGDILHIAKDQYPHSAGFFKEDAAIKIVIVR